MTARAKRCRCLKCRIQDAIVDGRGEETEIDVREVVLVLGACIDRLLLLVPEKEQLRIIEELHVQSEMMEIAVAGHA
jgi:hypothetical protein